MPEQKEISHLLLVTPGFPVSEQDTSCLPAVQQFIRAYQRIYPSTAITIVSLHYPYEWKTYNWYGCEVVSVGNKNKGGLFKALSLGRMLCAIRRAHETRPVSAILCFWLSDTALAAKLLSRALHVPYFIWMHGQDAMQGNKYLKKLKPQINQLAAISSEQKDVFEKAYGYAPAYIVNNGINEEIFPFFHSGHREIDILGVGSLIPLKQYHLLIELVALLRDKGFKHIKAVLVGEGPLDKALKEQIAVLGLENNIRCTGKLLHSEVLQLMSQAKIFVHTSAYEGHSTVLLEALYSGCKVVSLRPVSERAVQNFYLCNNIQEMSAECRKLLTERQEYFSTKVNDMADSARQITAILNDLIATI